MTPTNDHGEQGDASQAPHSGVQNSAVRALGIASIPGLCQESWTLSRARLMPACLVNTKASVSGPIRPAEMAADPTLAGSARLSPYHDSR
jgi:hypothetical protein